MKGASHSVAVAGATLRKDFWGQEIDEEVLCQDILLRAWSPNHTANRKGEAVPQDQAIVNDDQNCALRAASEGVACQACGHLRAL